MNEHKSTIWQNKKFLIGSILFLFLAMAIGWILYASFGHKLIEAMYEGRSVGFLNGIIEGQAKHPVEFYLKQADELVSLFLIKLILFLLIPAYLILLMNNRHHVSGIVFLRIGVILGVTIITILVIFYGYGNTWRLWKIPTISPCFSDFRFITGGIENQSLGYDPLVENPGHATMNYPRVWLMLSLIGIKESHVVYVGIIFAVLFFVSIFLYMPRTISNATASILMVSIFSPAVLFGVERGNIDLLMFFLLSVAIVCINKEHIISKVIAVASVLAAFVLKLFPIFGAVLLLREKKQTVIRLGLFILSFAIIYVIATYNDLILIRQGTLRSMSLGYGVDVLWMRVYAYSPIFGKIIRALSYIVVLICFAVVPRWACSKKFDNTESIEDDKRSIDAFRVGSGVYIGTFLLGSNWDYRLAFLLFVIPQLMLWSKSSSKFVSMISRSTIAGTIFSLWSLMIFGLHRENASGAGVCLLDEFSDWVIFLGLFFLFSYSLPAWIKGFTINIKSIFLRGIRE